MPTRARGLRWSRVHQEVIGIEEGLCRFAFEACFVFVGTQSVIEFGRIVDFDLNHPTVDVGVFGEGFGCFDDVFVALDHRAGDGGIHLFDGFDGLDRAEGVALGNGVIDFGQFEEDDIAEFVDREGAEADRGDVAVEGDVFVGVEVAEVLGVFVRHYRLGLCAVCIAVCCYAWRMAVRQFRRTKRSMRSIRLMASDSRRQTHGVRIAASESRREISARSLTAPASVSSLMILDSFRFIGLNRVESSGVHDDGLDCWLDHSLDGIE